MKNFLNLFKSKATAAKASKVAAEVREAKRAEYTDFVKIEAVQLVADAAHKHVAADENVMVKMVFNEAGEMVACNVEHYTPEAPVGLSATSTLVEKKLAQPPSPVLPAFSQAVPVAELKRAAAARVVTPAALAPVLTTADFSVYHVLGRGGQGSVSLVQYRGDGLLYALKTIKKPLLREYIHPFKEQNVMKELAGNYFFTQLRASFEDEENFYLVTDFYPGGDLVDMIYRKKLDASKTRLYCAQLVIALGELHRRRILHRDIKPANVLINRDGEAVFSDFGLAHTFGRSPETQPWTEREYWYERPVTYVPGRLRREDGTVPDLTEHRCGTAGYMALEIMENYPYSYQADVYSLGVLFYEMLNGKLPFGLRHRDIVNYEMMRRVRNGTVEVNDDVDEVARDLLVQMLDRDETRRPSLEQIKQHPWFASIDWDELSQRKQPRPFSPVEGFKPTQEAREVTFGTPYLEGDAPHPWYQWVSPRLQASKSSDKDKKVSRKTKTISARRPPASPPARSAHNASPVPALFAAFFASPIPASHAPAMSPVLQTLRGAADVSPSPAPATLDTSSVSVTCLSTSPAPVRLSPPNRGALHPAPRLVLRRRGCSLFTESTFVEDGQALESAQAGEAAKHTSAAAHAAAVHLDAAGAVNMDAPTRDAPRDTNALVDAIKPRASDRLNAAVCADSSVESAVTDATRVVSPSPKSSGIASRALVPRARERSPWAFV
ncbi:kinase-like domain-containing protein [Cubamyces lactineus]|nr:kinase-like domain-containing protein [Cubamyces lactineus]